MLIICDDCKRGRHDHSSRNVDMPGTFVGRLGHGDYCDCEAADNVDPDIERPGQVWMRCHDGYVDILYAEHCPVCR